MHVGKVGVTPCGWEVVQIQGILHLWSKMGQDWVMPCTAQLMWGQLFLCFRGVCSFSTAQVEIHFTSGKEGKLCGRVSARMSTQFGSRRVTISPKNTEVLAKDWNLRDVSGETPQIKGYASHTTALRSGKR